MTKRQLRALATLAVGLIWTLAAYVQGGPAPFVQVKPAQAGNENTGGASNASMAGATSSVMLYPVVHVVDGDTIDVEKDGQKVRVRLIGINAPESVDPRRPVQCFGREASTEMKRLLDGQSVSLETDPSQDLHDKYGRLLAYAFLPDPPNTSGQGGTNINLHMIEAGFAYEYTYDLPYKYQRRFKAAQANAERTGRGLWAAGVCGNAL